jgi:hypothetical protein
LAKVRCVNWFEIFDVVYRVSVAIIPVLLLGCVWWLRYHFASAKDHDALQVRVNAVEAGLRLSEAQILNITAAMESAPTRMDLLQSLGDLGERMSRMEASSEADRRQMHMQFTSLNQTLSTQNQYLHTLIEQGMLGGSK